MRYWFPFSVSGVHYLYSYNLGIFFILDEPSFLILEEAYEKGINNFSRLTGQITRLGEAGAFDDIHIKMDYKITSENVLSTFENCNFIVFEITNRCQLACEYCTYGNIYESSEEFRDIELSVKKAKNLIKYLYDNGCGGWQKNPYNKLTIGFYGGEPLLHPEFITSIIEFNKSLGIIPQYSITTNGVLLKKHLELLVENNFQILVSLDGNAEGNSARVMMNGRPSFYKIIESLNLLKERYPDYYKSNVSINAVLTKHSNIEREIEYFEKELGISNWNFSPLASHGIRKGKEIEFNQLKYSGPVLENDSFSRQVIKNLVWNSPLDYNLLFEDKFKFPNTMPTNTCIPFSKKAFLSSTGYLFACERIGMTLPLGYVSDDRIEIFSSDVASEYNLVLDKFRNLCTHCQKFPFCTKCALQSDFGDGCKEYLNGKTLVDWFSKSFSTIEKKGNILNSILDNAKLV